MDHTKAARRRSEPELFGAAEAAAELGVHQQNLRTLKGLPPPYAFLRSTTLWRADDIRRFAAERRKAADEPEEADAA